MDHFYGKSSFTDICQKSVQRSSAGAEEAKTVADKVGIGELDEHDEVVGEEGATAKAKAQQGNHQGSSSLTFFGSDNLKVSTIENISHIMIYLSLLK